MGAWYAHSVANLFMNMWAEEQIYIIDRPNDIL